MSFNETAELMRRFNDAFVRHDPAALVDLVGEDCVLENTNPAPSGSRHVGRAACLAVWQGLAAALEARFDVEEMFIAAEDRAILRWRYVWGEGENDSVRGVNLMRVRGGKIVEALGYVKGA